MRKFARPLFVLALLCLGITGSRAQGTPTVFINEIHYDNTGTDTGEFIEIAGPAGTDLTGITLCFITVRRRGAVYDTNSLSWNDPEPDERVWDSPSPIQPTAFRTARTDGIALVHGRHRPAVPELRRFVRRRRRSGEWHDRAPTSA